MFNWLFARRNHGTFILRIEDTDEERGREEWVSGILSALAWLGLECDEGPYRQSERYALYADALTRLWDGGYLYACGCSHEEVLERTKGNQTPGYDGHCRELGLAREGRALRFRTPRDGTTVVKDVIRGAVEFPHRAMEDFVVSKANSSPLFVLANVVDDIDMGITHVIRGEDLLPSTPKGILLWKALEGSEVELPVFAHLPMLVNEKRQKLSKRRDPVSLEYYREQGYLPEAFCNYLSLLGWNHPLGKELMTMKEIVQSFSLEDVNHSPAFFDVVKLTHIDGEHIRRLDSDEFIARSSAWLDTVTVPWERHCFEMDTYQRIAHLVQERVATFGEIIPMVDFFFLESPVYDKVAVESLVGNETTQRMLTMALNTFSDCSWETDTLHETTAAMGNEIGLKLSKAQAPIRVAVTGRRVGPPLFESMVILGREKVLARLQAFATLVARTTPE